MSAGRHPVTGPLRRRRGARAVAVVAFACLLAGIAAIGGVMGAFTSTTANPGNSFSAAPDFVAPTSSRSVIGKTEGGTPGFIRQGGTYHVYAEVSDTGSPASGVATVSSDTSTITSGATASPLASGSFSAGGLSYNYRTSSLTANGTLAEGSYAYTLALADNATNSRVESGYTVTVDNTAPAAADVQTANTSGGTAGRAEQGDTLTYTFSEPIEPGTILSGWDGSSTPVVVRLISGLILLGADGIQIYNAADSSQLPFGDLDLSGSDYVGGLLGVETARFGATGTQSQMTMSGNSISIVLGTHSDQDVLTAQGAANMSWDPVTAPTDRAGNSMSGAAVSESGAADPEF